MSNPLSPSSRTATCFHGSISHAHLQAVHVTQSWPAVESNVALNKRLAAIKNSSEGFLQVSSFLFGDIITNSASSTF